MNACEWIERDKPECTNTATNTILVDWCEEGGNPWMQGDKYEYEY